MLCVLFVHDNGNDQAARMQPALRRDARRVDHRRNTAFHVLGSAAVQPAVDLAWIERRAHTLDAHGVDVTAEHQRAPRGCPFENTDDVRTARRDFLKVDVEPELPHVRRDRLGRHALAFCTRHERRVDGVDGDQVAKERQAGIHGAVAVRQSAGRQSSVAVISRSRQSQSASAVAVAVGSRSRQSAVTSLLRWKR